MSAQLDIDETSFVSSFFNDAYPNWSAEQVEQAAERTLRAVKNLRDLGILISVTEEAEFDKEVGVDNFIRGFLITSEEVLKRWARGFFDDCKGKQDAIGSIGIHVHTAAAERTRLLLLSPPPALLTEDDDETLQSTQKAHEALQPYKEAHARLDALEFRLVTVALLAKNMTLKQLEDKKEELLRDFFAVEDDHEMAYTSEEKRRIVSHMHAKMDEVEPVAFDANLTSEAAMLRVMRQIGSVESANEVRCMIESSDSCVDSCDAELLRLAAAGAKFTLFRDSAFADADLAQHLSTGILLVPAFTGKALSDVLHDDRVLGVTQALDAFRSYRLRLWGAASLADFDTDAADRYVVLQQQFGGGDGVAGVGVALFESADAVSRIMKTIIDYYEDAAGLFRIAGNADALSKTDLIASMADAAAARNDTAAVAKFEGRCLCPLSGHGCNAGPFEDKDVAAHVPPGVFCAFVGSKVHLPLARKLQDVVAKKQELSLQFPNARQCGRCSHGPAREEERRQWMQGVVVRRRAAREAFVQM
ncbi:hypothetical protein EMIHUDRAFT_447624 [Emiliania huxleyi CCMP1516]|uniref:Uncharacterized protein n=2 Tax=Emiliania huxleyi TaxID=2903 RepID=A0A0D3JGP8_EMIH1|nr:hypothetical protein EMIHUDRAFT_447624 [Emiliania huxleyi CCMP1516]EOD22683.1 hypothetical protein EMIHUDRAFT_447624 [Emiliania huxleyi CCMP1516]|eukprot:XP_005775112.1 hypothetical protein EMIHUDRAFT_447624 [Emiliania huxleyi CCMP1516]